MAVYHLMHGLEDQDKDGTGVIARQVSPIDYGPEYSDAFQSLNDHVCRSGHILSEIKGGLFKHIPGVEGVFEETDGNKQQIFRIWLIKSLTS